MQLTEQSLILFFEQMARKDTSLFEKIERHNRFRVEPTGVFFTLPDLHHFLCRQSENPNRSDYKQFRQLLFKSPINLALKSCGAEISIAQNMAKVDRSIYVLTWPKTDTALPRSTIG